MTTVPVPNYTAARIRISELRAERGYTYDRLTELTGISRQVLIDLEAGRTRGAVTTWHALAHVYGVPIGDLLDHLCDGHPHPNETSLF